MIILHFEVGESLVLTKPTSYDYQIELFWANYIYILSS